MSGVEVTQAARDVADEHYPPHLWRKEARDDLAAAFAKFEQETIARHRTASTRQDGVSEGFQAEVGRWILACFGEEIAADRIERADRFIEEALELAQTVPGFTVERARALVEYVFARPVGEMGQEVGGVGVTLAALCNTYGISIAAEWERELARVWTKVEAIRAKQASKPVGSALPAALSDSSTPDKDGEALREARRALEPFVQVADCYDDREDDHFEVWVDAGPDRTIRASFKLAHYRKAREAAYSLDAALSASNDGEGK